MKESQLRYFSTVAQKHNFTEAAQAYFVTQPVISQQIAKLEENVGSQLIDRTRSHMALTESGEILYKSSQQMLDLMQAMKARVKNMQEGKVGHLRMFAVPSSVPEVCDCLNVFRTRYPDIQVDIDIGTGIEQLTSMDKRMHDLYFTFLTHAESQPDMDLFPTGENRFALVVNKSDSPKVDLYDFGFLAHRPLITEYKVTGPFLVNKILKVCENRGRAEENIIACSSFLSVSLMVNANMGFTILPLNMARSCYSEHVDIYPIPGDDAVNLNAVAWHKNPENEATKTFLDVAREVLK